MQSRTSSLIHRVHVSRLRLVVFPTTSAPFIVRFFGDLLIRFLRHRTSSRRRSDGSCPRAIPICAPLEVDHVAVTTRLDPRSETTLPHVAAPPRSLTNLKREAEEDWSR